jgi:hypothetical protein
MHMRMVVKVLAPRMEHGDKADFGAEMARIGCDRGQSLGRGLEQYGYTAALFWNAISAAADGKVNTTWKYGTGSNSACRSASHAARAGPWHFGQWRLRHEL